MKNVKKLLSGLITLAATAVLSAVCVISAGAYAYGDYEYDYYNDGVEIIDYYGSASVIEIPSEINGTAVEYIDAGAFYNCDSITSVKVPTGVKSIMDWCFFDCNNLKSITIPGSVKYIYDQSVGYAYDEDYNTVKSSDLKIYCYEGTAAEQYAKDNGFAYELLTCNHSVKWTTVYEPTYFDTGLKYGTCSKCGISMEEDIPVKKMTAPKLTLGGRSSTAIRLNWKKDIYATGYYIEQYKSGKWTRIKTIEDNYTTTYRIDGLSPTTNYQFRIRKYMKEYSWSGNLNSAYSSYSPTLTVTTLPSGVKGLRVAGRTADALRINWDKNASVSGYIIEQKKSGKWVRIAKATNNSTTTCRIGGLKSATLYDFRIQTYKNVTNGALKSGYVYISALTTNPKNAVIDKGAYARVTSKYYNSQWFTYDSWWDRWEAVSDVSQFTDGKGNMYFAYVSTSDKLVIKRLGTDLSTATVATISKAMPNVGTVTADDKGYFYVVWGASGGYTQSQTAIKICKYNSSGKLIKSVSYTGGEIDTAIPFEAGNCDAKVKNGVLYLLFAKKRFDGHQQAIECVVRTSDMKKLDDARDFWCSHSFAQRAYIDSKGEIWYANHGDAYPRGFLISGPDGDKNVLHFYCSKEAWDAYDMMTVNATNAEMGGLAETSKGMFFVGASVKGLAEKEYNSQPKNIFITSADGSYKLNGAVSRTGTVFGEKITDTNIKWLTNYSSGTTVSNVQVVPTNDDRIVIMWSTFNENTYGVNNYYMILAANGDVLQKAVKIVNVSLNNCETPLYKNGCLYWVAHSYDKEGTALYKLDIGNPVSISYPANFKVSSRTSSSLRLNWTKNTNATGYCIDIYKSGKWVRVATIKSNATTSCNITKLSASTIYKFRIQSYKNINGTTVKSAFSYLTAATSKKS